MQNFPSRIRLGAALGIALFTFLVLSSTLPVIPRSLTAWTVGTISFLLLTLLALKDSAIGRIKHRTRHTIVFLTLAIIAATIGLIAFHLIRSTPKAASVHILTLHLFLPICAIASTWFLLHTLFAEQYAALYYRSNQGLQFVDQPEPNDWDFLYFSFVMGATAQTSDTFITSRSIRRLALGQAIISFWFFVGIIGMTINIVSDMVGAK